jgi:hypothetical protein
MLPPDPPLWKIFGAAILSLAGLFWFLRLLPGYWNGRGFAASFYRYEPVPSVWPWGKILWHAFVRTSPLLITVVALMVPCLLVEYLAPPAPRWVSLPVAILLSVLYLVAPPLVALTNHPRFLIPPYLREKPGILVEVWRLHLRPRLSVRGESRRS